jgi:HD-GYP domain-containing protein (c-di-GMP phosphodiesterase class II)
MRLAVLFVATVAVCGALDRSGGAGFDWLELYTYKMRVAMHAQRHPEWTERARQQIVVVTISDETFTSHPDFEKLHGPPVPRDYHAKVVRDLTRAGASVIVFDLVFDIPRPQDKQLAEAARRSGKVLWASLFEGDTNIRPNATLLKASPRYGHIIVPKDAERPVIDHIEAVHRHASGRLEPSLSLQAALMARGQADQPIRRVTGGWQAGDFFIPADEEGNLQINYFGRPKEVFPPHPYENIYLGGVDDPFFRQTNFFRGKIVLIGDTTKVGNDLPYTPVGAMAGVEMHAHAVATLLQGQAVRAAPTLGNVAIIAFLSGLVCLCASLRRLGSFVLAAGMLALLYPCLNVLLFVDHGVALHLTGPMAALVVCTLGVLIERGLSEEREKERMFDALVFAAASAIEDRDPTTSGHSRRVTQMTVSLAHAVSASHEGRFKKVHFSRSDLRALNYAGQLHDFGKIGVREAILVKSHKVEPMHFQTIKDRLLLLRSAREKQAAQCQIEILLEHPREEALPMLDEIKAQLDEENSAINSDLVLLERANDPAATFLPDEEYGALQELLTRLKSLHYEDESGASLPLITEDERDALSIRRGSLTREEYKQVQDHAQMSYNFLRQIPWTQELSQIPQIAHAHHEKLDGSGYPLGLKDEQISLQARMMTVADIYDALTASDRPYKRAMPPERACKILREEAARGQLDIDLVELFISHEVYKSVQEA